jgi:hypothetical protein
MSSPRFLLCLSLLLVTTIGYSQNNLTPFASKAAKSYGDIPLAFESNRGQVPAGIDFLSRGTESTVELGSDRAIFTLAKKDQRAIHQVMFQWLGAGNAKAIGEDKLAGRTNYLVGEPQHWLRGIANYSRVRYTAIYPGIDLVYYGNHRSLEYDLELHPGADASKMAFGVQGADQLRLQADGSLSVETAAGTLIWEKPIAYQFKNGERQLVAVSYKLNAKPQTVAFALGPYDHSLPLTIDPTLAYGALIGPTSFGQYVAADSNGSAYLLTETISSEYPTTPGSYMPTGSFSWQPPSLYGGPGHPLLAITKFSPDGSTLVYSTYLGGSQFVCSDPNAETPSGNRAGGIAVDSNGDAIVTGTTDDTNFPVTADAIQSTDKNCSVPQDAIVSKLSPDGSSLLYSTYLGSSGNDTGNSVAVDVSGNIFVGGLAQQTDFPHTTNLSSCTGYCSDVFVTKINASGTLGYSLLFGGANSGENWPTLNAVAVDSSSNAYITGTTSVPLPVVNALQPTMSSSIIAFAGEVKPDGSGFTFLTYLGGSLGSEGYGIAVDSGGNIYVDGTTWDNNFPTANAYQSQNKNPSTANYNGSNGFLTKYSPGGQSYVYSTYIGGSANTGEVGIAVGPNDEPYLAGNSSAVNYPVTSDAFLPTNLPNHYTSTFTVFAANGRSLVYSTYLSGTTVNGAGAQATSIAVTPNGQNAFVAGFSLNTSYNIEDFPVTPGAYDNPNTGQPSNNWASAQVSATFLANFCLSCTSPANLTITSPQNSAVVTNPVDFIAQAYDPSGVAALQIYVVPGTVAYQTTASKLNKKLNIAPGSYGVVVQEWGNDGSYLKKTVDITVQNAPPTVTITSPAAGVTVSNPVHVAATARVNGTGTIAHYRVYSAPNVAVYDINASSLNAYIALPQGKVNLTVVAWDSSGAAGSTSANITVNGGTNGGAQVIVSSPLNYSTVSSPVTFTAKATTSCNKGIYALQVYTNPGVVAYTAYASSVNTAVTLSPGYYYGAVQAWDNCGATFSTPVQFDVQ